MPPFQWQAPPQPYVNTIGDLLRAPGYARADAAQQIGEVQARAALQSGQAWGQGIQQAGQAIGSIPERLQQQKAADQTAQMRDQAITEGQQKINDLKMLDDAFSKPGGREAIINSLPGHLRPTVSKQFTEADEAAAKYQAAQITAEKASEEYVFDMAKKIKEHGYDANAAQIAISHAKSTFANNPSLMQQVTQIEQSLHANPTPDGVKAIVQPIIDTGNAIRAKTPEPFNLREGETHFDATGKPLVSVPSKPTKETLAAVIADQKSTPEEKQRAKDTIAAMGDNQQIADDRRYEDIVSRGKLGQKVSPEDKAWAESHEQMKGLSAPQLVQGAGGTFYTVPKSGGAAVPVEGVRSRPEQEFVTRGGVVTPIPKGTAQPGDVPYTPSQNEGAQQSKYESQYRQVLQRTMSSRSGGLGLEDQKVNQALHLISIFDQSKDPKTGDYNIPKVLQTELAMGLARLISPTGVVGEGTVKEINQRTAVSDVAGLVTYLTGTPVTGNTQAVFKMLKDSIERQGHVAESNRETYLDSIRALAPSDLEEERRTRMEQALKLNRMPKAYEPGSGKEPAVGDTMKKYNATYKWDGTGWQKQAE